MKENPIVKKGDKILIITSHTAPQLNGKVVTVTNLYCQSGIGNTEIGYITVTENEGKGKKNYNIFNNYNGYLKDSYCFPDRESQIKSLKDSLKDIEKEKKVLLSKEKEINDKINHLERYETEEDFVAEKLDKILTAHAENKDQKVRTNAIADVLKELKSSNLL